MVKAICYTVAAILVCVGLFIFSELYMMKQIDEFAVALDGYAVRTLWTDKKSKLQILVPHNDISYVDYWLSEACGLLYNGNYELALGKVEVLKEIAKNLPDAYRIRLENIF